MICIGFVDSSDEISHLRSMHACETWTQEEKDELHRLWLAGLSIAQIGRRLNKSKNAVVGKVDRMHLPKRPSPINPAAVKRCKVPPPKPVQAIGTGRQCLCCGRWFLSPEPKRINRRCAECDEMLNSNGASFLTVYQATVLV